MRKIGAYLFLFTFLVLAACAPEPWGTKWDRFIDQEGVTVEIREDTRVISLPNGIRVIETRNNGKVTSSATDDSGYGAVLCNWDIFVHLHNYLDMCFPKKYIRHKARMSKAIDKINDFIIANSMEPVTKEMLTTAAKKRGRNKMDCKSKSLENIAQRFLELPEDEFFSGVEELLSVPRPPLYDPCL